MKNLLLYLLFSLLPFSFCLPAKNTKEESDLHLIPSKFSLLPPNKPVYSSFDCPENETFSLCDANCESSCTSLRDPIPCSDECVSGCICNDGYVRDLNGSCIPTENCTVSKVESPEEVDFCPKNEIFSPCLAHCQKNCINWSDANTPCLKVCVPGCICDNGLVRGIYGDCISPRKCPPRQKLQDVLGNIAIDCPINEHFDSCKGHCQKNCSNWDQDLKCKKMCVPGCVCDDDFVRGSFGKCVLTNKCSFEQIPTLIKKKKTRRNSCRDGEERSPVLPIADSSAYCDYGNGCIELCPPTYLNGCVCKKGEVRGEDGHCIDRRLLPNANEIHFMREDYMQTPVNIESDSNTEIYTEVFESSEISEKSIIDSTFSSTVNSGLEVSTQTTNNEKHSTTEVDDLLFEGFKGRLNGCPDSQKCLEWCHEKGFPNGDCMESFLIELTCICFRI